MGTKKILRFWKGFFGPQSSLVMTTLNHRGAPKKVTQENLVKHLLEIILEVILVQDGPPSLVGFTNSNYITIITTINPYICT